MKRREFWLAGALVLLATALVLADGWFERDYASAHLDHGRFADVAVYAPPQPETARQVLLLLGDAQGWSADDTQRARALVERGALVIGIDSQDFFAALDEDSDECEFPDGDLENLSHYVQAYFHLPAYHLPLLAGEGSAGAFAFATLAQAPANTFAGLLTQDFCPQLPLRKPVCAGEGLQTLPGADGYPLVTAASHLSAPWLAFTTPDFQCAVAVNADFAAQTMPAPVLADQPPFGAAFAALAARAGEVVQAAPEDLAGLPLEEVPALPTLGAHPENSDLLAIFLSGDGGWAGLDKEVADALAAHNIPVVGWDSLRYFWTPRTPDSMAADADRVIRYYRQHWHRSRVLLLGYSQGANVLPFLLNHLPPPSHDSVALAALLGLEEEADFEFHVGNWFSRSHGLPVRPEIARNQGTPLLCLYGRDETESPCPSLNVASVQAVALPGGHHFDGDYPALAQRILAAVP